MRVMIDGNQYAAILTTDHAASSYGQPVLVVSGLALGTLDVQVGRVELIQADEGEVGALVCAGYFLPWARDSVVRGAQS